MIKFIQYIEDLKAIVLEFAECGTLHDYLLKQCAPIGNLGSIYLIINRMELETYMEYSIDGSNTLFAQ